MTKKQAEWIVEQGQLDGLSNENIHLTKLNGEWAVKVYNKTTNNRQTAADYAYSAAQGNW